MTRSYRGDVLHGGGPVLRQKSAIPDLRSRGKVGIAKAIARAERRKQITREQADCLDLILRKADPKKAMRMLVAWRRRFARNKSLALSESHQKRHRLGC